MALKNKIFILDKCLVLITPFHYTIFFTSFVINKLHKELEIKMIRDNIFFTLINIFCAFLITKFVFVIFLQQKVSFP